MMELPFSGSTNKELIGGKQTYQVKHEDNSFLVLAGTGYKKSGKTYSVYHK